MHIGLEATNLRSQRLGGGVALHGKLGSQLDDVRRQIEILRQELMDIREST